MKDKEIRGYCNYCKNTIYIGDAYTKDRRGRLYCPACYIQEETFTDDFGTDNFGDLREE
jgi:hypothetical protein